LDIGNFFQSIGDKVSKVMVPNSIFQDLMSIKIAIVLIPVSLLISSLALLVLAISHSRSKNSLPFDATPSRFLTNSNDPAGQ
jgi:hypothetical protein